MTPETRQHVHEDASEAGSSLLMEAAHVEAFIVGWIDDQEVFHWRNAGGSSTARGMIENLRDLARENFLSDDDEEPA